MGKETKAKLLKGLPQKEIGWVHCRGPGGEDFYITSTQDRSAYMLYKAVDGGYERIAKDKTPLPFNEIISPEAAAVRKKKADR